MQGFDDPEVAMRTLYVPSAMDARIGVLAQSAGVARGDIIRAALLRQLARWEAAGGEVLLREDLAGAEMSIPTEPPSGYF